MRTKWLNDKSILVLIILLSGCIRFYNLDFQSFWLDELHTVIEADASLRWHNMLDYLRSSDQHPPFFFAIEKLLFWTFGSTEFVARSVSAIAGIVSIWIIYLLGRELHSSKLGLIAALLTCFNYFHIFYSQEARPYSLVFLFTCLSFLYLINLIRNPCWIHSVLYTLWTASMLYTHYFGLFIFLSQTAILSIFVFNKRKDVKQYVKHTTLSVLLVVIFYIPWIPYLLSMAAIKKFWIAPISPSFAIDYFYGFFGNADILKPFLLLFLVLASIQFVWSTKKLNYRTIQADPYTFSFIVCFLWITVTYLIPYLRSVLVVPMLFPRYAIVTLPAFILILSFGIESVSHRIPKVLLLGTFCLLSFFDITIHKNYYTQVHKTQFRELAEFIASDKNYSYPVLCDATAWHQQYYLQKKMGYSSPILEGNLDHQLDSILSKGHSPNHKGFWLIGAHDSQKPRTELLNQIDSAFVLLQQQDFYDAWAKLYITHDVIGKNILIMDHRSFSTERPFTWNGDSVIAIWNKEIKSDSFLLEKGMYVLKVQMAGTPASKIYPHIQIQINDKSVGNFYISESLKYYNLSFENTLDCRVNIHITMDNDAYFERTGEDRNAFIKSILIYREDKI